MPNKYRFKKAKVGIETAEPVKEKRGRPTVMESWGDSSLPLRAFKMRSSGLTWQQIGEGLDVSRSTARRLAAKYQEENQSNMDTTQGSTVPEICDTDFYEGTSQGVVLSIDNDILERMPKTFQVFYSLLRKAGYVDRRTDERP